MKFNKPEKTNGVQLKSELAAIGIIVDEIFDDGDGYLSIEISDKLEVKALEIINNHIGVNPEIEKNVKKNALLEKLGITEEEAKLLLS